MSIEKFTISRDADIYEAFPAIERTASGHLICVFLECTSHTDRSYTRIVYKVSKDQGRTWGPKLYLTDEAKNEDYSYDCPSIVRLRDDRIVIVINKVYQHQDANWGEFHKGVNELYMSDDEGLSWQGPVKTPIEGIVPDTLCELLSGRWLLSAHRVSKEHGYLEQMLWYTDDQGNHWNGPITVASEEGLHFCEVSIVQLPDQSLVAFMRENSNVGKGCFKAISHDHGETWTDLHEMPLPGCHRPVARMLTSGKIMLTYRFYPGGPTGYNTNHILFAALMDLESAKETNYKNQWIRSMPIDYDRSLQADNGYSGWVQFEDGEIYIVQYLADDAPKCQIRGYSLRESDFYLSS